MTVITLTLNPAFDVHCQAGDLRLFHESIARITSREAGGKGVNISRALHAFGIPSRAVVTVGEENAKEFCELLRRDGLDCTTVSVAGRIRENFTFHEDGKPETRISFDGFACSPDLLLQVEQAVGTVDEGCIVTFTGSAPVGISAGDVCRLLDSFRRKGARIVIDSRLFSLSDLIGFRPWLIKPNQDEAKAYLGQAVATPEDAAQMAISLHRKGVENVMISLGRQGAVLSCGQGIFFAAAPDITPLSTIGAGDSTIGGFLAAFSQGLAPQQCLEYAVCFGSAACLTPGSQPPRRENILALLHRHEAAL